MRHNNLKLTNALLRGALALLMAGAAACDSESPTTAGDRPAMVDPAGARDFFLASVPLEGMPDVRVDAWGHDLTVESDTVVSFDLVLTNRSDRTIYPPAQVEIVDIRPDAVTVLNRDNLIPANLILFYLDGHMGDDNRLDPGESTSGVHIRFGMPRLMSFSLGLRLEARAFGPESISGVVFEDAVRDGKFDPALEVGLARQWLHLYSAPDSATSPHLVASAQTDPSGRYAFHDVGAGVYSVSAFGPAGWEPTTPNPRLVTLIEGQDGKVVPARGVNFGFFDPSPPDSISLYDADVRAGNERNDDFVNPWSPSEHDYVLHVYAPIYVRAPVGAISGSQVWINDTLVWEVHCDPHNILNDCLSGGRPSASVRVRLPQGLVETGRNHIRIVVEGWGEPFWIYTIWRIPAAPNG